MTPRMPTAAVAMSGGVDSSVAAALLAEDGYNVFGVTMHLPAFDPDGQARACRGTKGIDDARRVAGTLGIPFHSLDFREEFRRTVVRDFSDGYARGRTPNPCARCNEWLKFGALLERVNALGADFLATGHYVRKTRDEAADRFGLETVPSPDDQSYFLAGLDQRQLAAAIFPLGDCTKEDVRRKARELRLPVHDKPGSQDLCFLPAGRYREFLREQRPDACRPGPVLYVDGRELARHDGIAGYTVGQRRGLGIAWPESLYVVRLDPARNAVIVGEKRHIMRATVAIEGVNWLAPPPADEVPARVKIRYNHTGGAARLRATAGGGALVRFDEPQEAPCPGQAAVFYDGATVLGGGTISDFPATEDA